MAHATSGGAPIVSRTTSTRRRLLTTARAPPSSWGAWIAKPTTTTRWRLQSTLTLLHHVRMSIAAGRPSYRAAQPSQRVDVCTAPRLHRHRFFRRLCGSAHRLRRRAPGPPCRVSAPGSRDSPRRRWKPRGTSACGYWCCSSGFRSSAGCCISSSTGSTTSRSCLEAHTSSGRLRGRAARRRKVGSRRTAALKFAAARQQDERCAYALPRLMLRSSKRREALLRLHPSLHPSTCATHPTCHAGKIVRTTRSGLRRCQRQWCRHHA